MTKERIRAWVREYGESGCYISFSGGKDSTVLLDIVRNGCGYDKIPAVFVDVPTQYPELKEFVETFENVEIIKPKMNFVQVCEKYGFPMISKEVSECVSGAKKYLTRLREDGTLPSRAEQSRAEQSRAERLPYAQFYRKLSGIGEYRKPENEYEGGYDAKYRRIQGIGEYSKSQNGKQRRWQQSAFSDNVRDADERYQESGKGEYP